MEQIEMKPITVTFKHTDEEIELYKIIDEHTSKTAFIKDTLIQVLLHKNNTSVMKTKAQSSEIHDIFEGL